MGGAKNGREDSRTGVERGRSQDAPIMWTLMYETYLELQTGWMNAAQMSEGCTLSSPGTSSGFLRQLIQVKFSNLLQQ